MNFCRLFFTCTDGGGAPEGGVNVGLTATVWTTGSAAAANYLLKETDLFLLFFSLAVVGDGPTIVNINIFLRSISKIDDYKMVSPRFASHVRYWMMGVTVLTVPVCTWLFYTPSSVVAVFFVFIAHGAPTAAVILYIWLFWS